MPSSPSQGNETLLPLSTHKDARDGEEAGGHPHGHPRSSGQPGGGSVVTNVPPTPKPTPPPTAPARRARQDATGTVSGEKARQAEREEEDKKKEKRRRKSSFPLDASTQVAGDGRGSSRRRTIPAAPHRQLFLVGNDPDDPFATLLGAGIHSMNTQNRHNFSQADPEGRAKGKGECAADMGKKKMVGVGDHQGEARQANEDGEPTGVSFFYTTSPNAPWPSPNRRQGFATRQASIGSGISNNDMAPTAARSTTTLPPADGAATGNSTAAPPPPTSAADGDGEGDDNHRANKDGHAATHTHIGLPHKFARRFYEPIELQVESLSTFVVKAVFALWYLMCVACLVVEVIPQAQWSVVDVCGRGLTTHLRHWDRWSSTCVTRTASTAPAAPPGAVDITWAGGDLSFLNDNLKLYRRVVLSLPRSTAQTEKTRTYTIQARVATKALDANGAPLPGSPSSSTGVTFTAELTCEREHSRCRPVRLPEELLLMRPITFDKEQVEVTLVAPPQELADAIAGSSAAAVGIAYQKRAYTLGSLIWRYAFLLLSFLHLMRFVASQRYTATLYEQSWVIILQIALVWYLDPLYACNMVTQPLPVLLAFLEFRMPIYFITITIAFMFSVMTASMFWTQRGASEAKQNKKTAPTDKEGSHSDDGDDGDGDDDDHPSSDTESETGSCDACEDMERHRNRPRKSFAERVWAALFTSPNVYDPPAWTKVVTVMYITAVFTLDIVDCAIEPGNWSPGSNTAEKFRGVYWAEISLLLFGGVVCLGLLFYLRNYLGNKPYLESRPQQLACRVFIMVFLVTIVYYIIHCFVFFFYYNRDFAATASLTPFSQLPAVMIACGFTNIMTLVYTSRNRPEGVPIHPTDQRWKFMVWPDTWYRWLARHGGSQYIFYTEEEETRFYKTQFEFRKRQFLAKQRRRHTRDWHRHFSGHSQVDGGGSFGDDLSWMTDVSTLAAVARNMDTNASTTGGGGAPVLSESHLLHEPSGSGSEEAEEDHDLVVGSNATPAKKKKDKHNINSGNRAAVRTKPQSPAHAPADYQTQKGSESPLPQQDSGSAKRLDGGSRDNSEADVLAEGAGGSGARGTRAAPNKDSQLGFGGDGEDGDDDCLRRAKTLRAEDLRALHHLSQNHARTEEEADAAGPAAANTSSANNHNRPRRARNGSEGEDGPGPLARTHTFTVTPAKRSASAMTASGWGGRSADDDLFRRVYGGKIMNMDRFSTYFLAEGNSNRNTDSNNNNNNAPSFGRRDIMNTTRLGEEPLGNSLYMVEGPAKRRSRLQQRTTDDGGGAGDSVRQTRNCSFVSSFTGGGDAMGPHRSPSQLVHRRSRSHDGYGRASALSGFTRPASRPGSRGGSPTTATLTNAAWPTHGRTHSALSGNGASNEAEGEGEVLRAYERFLPDTAVDGADAAGAEADKAGRTPGSFILRSIVMARNKLGALVSTAERNLLERPIRNLDKFEMNFIDAAYRPFQTCSYLPFFNLETAVDCYNLSWEAYGVEESAGDAHIETGLKVAPENVPKAAVHGVKKIFCGCCAASESESERDEDGQGAEEEDDGDGGGGGGGERANEMVEGGEEQRKLKKKRGLEGQQQQHQHDTAAAVDVEPVASATGSELGSSEDTVSVPVDDSRSSSPTRTASPQSPQPGRGSDGAAASTTTAPATPTTQATAAAPPAPVVGTGLLPINCEKYGYKLLYVTVVKEVQVLICRIDVEEPEHRGKAPRIVVAFRGTANLSNAKYDANMHRVVWSEMEEPLPEEDNGNSEGGDGMSTIASTMNKAYLGCASCCRSLLAKSSWRPTCHAGFLAIWRAMQPKVMPKLLAVLKEDSGTVYRVFTTGHSLGGALASLCAYSAHRALAKMDYPIPDITVYTYGQPRMGNRVFRRVYDKAVPRSFRIMNESDMVVTFTMFGGYHVGIEVDVDRNGNYIIKPTDMEKMFSPTKGRGISLLNHLMSNYGISLNAVAQRTTCPARCQGCYLTADPEKIRLEEERDAAQQAMQAAL